jgi:hypothetical protein
LPPKTPVPLPRPPTLVAEPAPEAPAAAEGPPAQQASLAPAPKPEPAIVRGGHGVDLGGAVSVDRLRMLWNAVRSSQPRLLHGLRPVANTRRAAHGRRADVRLVAGPLASAEDAARLCAALLDTGRFCEPTRFEGHRLR